MEELQEKGSSPGHPSLAQKTALTRLISHDPKSENFIPALRAVLNSEEYDDNLKGNEASDLINLLDNALNIVPPNSDLHHKCLHRLTKICSLATQLPSSYLIPDFHLTKQNLFPINLTALSEVWAGRYNGQKVLLKYIKMDEEDNLEDIYKAFYKQVVVWKNLSHPNILPLFGVSITSDRLCSILERTTHSNIHKYLRSKPEGNRHTLLLDILEGMHYLHSYDVVHGDLRGSSILVDDGGHALLSDFGFSYTAREEDGFSALMTKFQRAKTRWTAPELFNPGPDNTTWIIRIPTKESDAYAFAMVVVEVLTGKAPFQWRDDTDLKWRVLRGERPEKPIPVIGPGLSDNVWKIVQKCWHEDANQRPKISDVLGCFKGVGNERFANSERDLQDLSDNGATIKGPGNMLFIPPDIQTEFIDTKALEQGLKISSVSSGPQTNLPMDAPQENGDIRQPGFTLSSISLTQLVSLDSQSQDLVPSLRRVLSKQEDFDNFIDRLQDDESLQFISFLDKMVDHLKDVDLYRACLRAMRKTCGLKGQLPPSYMIEEKLLIRTDDYPISAGGYSDVYTGLYNGRKVAMKYLRVSQMDDPEKLYKEFCKEAVVWRQLSHPNILSLFGVSIKKPYMLCMVSDWMLHSHVRKFLGIHPEANRHSLLLDVLKGLQYLHSRDIVHGDLKGLNILIDDGEVARLADFGLASVTNDDNSVNASTVKIDRGTIRWMAPELLSQLSDDLDVEIPGIRHPTKECDVYAFAMVVIEVITGKIPFPKLSNNEVPRRIKLGQRPERPMPETRLGLSDGMWEMVKESWQEDATKRPKISLLLDCFSTDVIEQV